MPADASFKPPRKKLNILWWLGGLLILLFGLFVLQLFGPDPRIIISPQTTYIIEPLGPEGLPDYERYVLELYREGVTPQNNAATLLWQALWPGELDPPQYAAVAKELGLTRIPSEKDSLENLYSQSTRIAAWLINPIGRDSAVAESPDNESAFDDEQFEMQRLAAEAAERIIDQAMSRPWTSEQIPPLAKWATENQNPFDLILEASRRPRCYFPSPSLIDGKSDTLVAMLLPGAQCVRECGRSLSARAMWHVGEGRLEDAWQDLLAAHRIGRLTAQGHTMVEQLVGIAISGIACDATVTMLHHGNLTADQARQAQRDLAALAQFSGMPDALDRMERLSYLDMAAHFGQMDKQMLSQLQVGDELSYLNMLSVDWNIVLRKGNEFYDRLVAAARMPTRAAREQAFARIDVDLLRMERDLHRPRTFVTAAISPSRRGDAVAVVMLNLFLPAIDAAMNAQTRANTNLELTRLAAALAVYRVEHGAYPDKLDDLVPAVLEKLPVDLYNAKPFVYKRDGEGYLLYSAGENRADNGGSNEQSGILKGETLDDADAESQELRPTIPSGADDISIRVPRPPLEVPKVGLPAAQSY